MQARLALEHGKRLFLVEPLVLRESWARRYAEYQGTTVVESFGSSRHWWPACLSRRS
jgi:hypothetical protein